MLRKLNMPFTRVAGLAALGFAFLIVLGNVIALPAGLPLPGDPVGKATAFFGPKRDVVGVATAFAPAAWVLATVFGAGAVATLWRSERARGEAWSLVGFAGLALQNVAFAGVFAIRLALTAQQDTAGLWALHGALFTLNGTFLAIALIGLSIAGRRAGLIHRWHSIVGAVSAVLMFSSATLTSLVIEQEGPLGLLGLAGWLMWVVWIAAYGLTLVRLNR